MQETISQALQPQKATYSKLQNVGIFIFLLVVCYYNYHYHYHFLYNYHYHYHYHYHYYIVNLTRRRGSLQREPSEPRAATSKSPELQAEIPDAWGPRAAQDQCCHVGPSRAPLRGDPGFLQKGFGIFFVSWYMAGLELICWSALYT